MNPKFLIILSLLLGSSSAMAQTINNALHFDGTDDYVQLDTFPTIDFSNGFSYTAWVRWDNFYSWSRLLDISNGPYNDNIIISNVEKTDTHRLTVFNGSTNSHLNFPDAAVKNQWTHIAVTIDVSGLAKFYKDGIPMLRKYVFVPSILKRSICYLGKSAFEEDAYFGGRMDEVSILNKELNEVEIATLKDNYLAGNEDNLVAYMKVLPYLYSWRAFIL
jgi:arabinan endo-1,5-alpha-L-arabinosidase